MTCLDTTLGRLPAGRLESMRADCRHGGRIFAGAYLSGGRPQDLSHALNAARAAQMIADEIEARESEAEARRARHTLAPDSIIGGDLADLADALDHLARALRMRQYHAVATYRLMADNARWHVSQAAAASHIRARAADRFLKAEAASHARARARR